MRKIRLILSLVLLGVALYVTMRPGAPLSSAMFSALYVSTNGTPQNPLPQETEASKIALNSPRKSSGAIPNDQLSQIVDQFRKSLSVPDLIAAKNELQKLLEQTPGLHRDIPALVKDNQLDARQQRAIVHTLGLLSDPEAQKTLSAIALNSEESSSNRTQALVSLGEVEVPSRTTIDTLWTLATSSQSENSNIAESALLQLGIVTGQLQKNDPTLSDETLRNLISYWQNTEPSATGAEIQLSIAALGNTARTEILPYLEPYVHSPIADLRNASIYALWHVPGESADALLTDALSADKSSTVRRTAAEVLAHRSLNDEYLQGVSEALLKESDAAIRHQLIAMLAPHKEARPSLETLLANESDQENYELLISSLN